jgi:UDP-N-acetylglucosamine 4-epimerase
MGYQSITFPEGSKFLITGAAGFIGSNLVEALLKMDMNVRCLENFSTGKKENIEPFMGNSNFELIEGDIRDFNICLDACDGIDYISHQAAWGSVPRSIAMPQVYEEINIKGTLNMLEAAKQKNVKRFVYASSSSVYGDHPALPKQEGIEGNVLSPYALTKKVNEEYGRLYKELYGLETIGLRYFNVFGKRQDPNGYYAAVIPKFVKALLNNESPTINGDGKQSRDFTYIENVIEANFKAFIANAEATGQAYNIAFGAQTYLIDLYYKLCEQLGKKIEPIFGPDRTGDIKHSNADISKAKDLLGYDPQYDFNTGLEMAVDWYKNNLYQEAAKD